MADGTISRLQALIAQLQGALQGQRRVAGMVSGAGAVQAGSGFTVVRNGTGDYTITFTTAFSGAPVVTLTNGADAVNVLPKLKNGVTPSSTSFSVFTLTTAGANIDAQFTFVALAE